MVETLKQTLLVTLLAFTTMAHAELNFVSWGGASAQSQQAGQAMYINYGPMRASAFGIIRSSEPWVHSGKNIQQHMPNRPEVMARSIVANPEWWADHGEAVEERYLVWMVTAGL